MRVLDFISSSTQVLGEPVRADGGIDGELDQPVRVRALARRRDCCREEARRERHSVRRNLDLQHRIGANRVAVLDQSRDDRIRRLQPRAGDDVPLRSPDRIRFGA